MFFYLSGCSSISFLISLSVWFSSSSVSVCMCKLTRYRGRLVFLGYSDRCFASWPGIEEGLYSGVTQIDVSQAYPVLRKVCILGLLRSMFRKLTQYQGRLVFWGYSDRCFASLPSIEEGLYSWVTQIDVSQTYPVSRKACTLGLLRWCFADLPSVEEGLYSGVT